MSTVLCPSCGRENPAGFQFCGFCTAPLAAPEPRREERKVVTVLFCDLVGFTQRSEAMDPEDVRGLLRGYHERLRRELERFGGTVEKFIGDAVMAVFGAPLPQGDHARRAAAAAWDMHQAQAVVNERWEARGLPPFGLGIGLSSGLVAAALLGSEERLEYSLVGDAVNLAQRLQQWAGAGETVVSRPTADALGADGELEPLEPAQVKGRDATVHAFRLVKVCR